MWGEVLAGEVLAGEALAERGAPERRPAAAVRPASRAAVQSRSRAAAVGGPCWGFASVPTAAAAAPTVPPVSPEPAGDAAASAAAAGQVAWSPVWTIVSIALAALVVVVVVRRGWWRLPPLVQPDSPGRPLREAALFIAAFICGGVGVQVARRIAGPSPSPALTLEAATVVAVGQAVGQALVVALAAVALAGFWRARSSKAPSAGRAVAVGVAAWLPAWVLAAAAAALGAAVANLIRDQPRDVIAHDILRLIADAWHGSAGAGGSGGGVWVWLLIALVVTVVPALEEAIYRGLLQPAMVTASGGRWRGILLTSGVFALAHAGIARPESLPALLVLGIAFGWARERTGTLLAPMVMHALFNAGNVAAAVVVG